MSCSSQTTSSFQVNAFPPTMCVVCCAAVKMYSDQSNRLKAPLRPQSASFGQTRNENLGGARAQKGGVAIVLMELLVPCDADSNICPFFTQSGAYAGLRAQAITLRLNLLTLLIYKGLLSLMRSEVLSGFNDDHQSSHLSNGRHGYSSRTLS